MSNKAEIPSKILHFCRMPQGRGFTLPSAASSYSATEQSLGCFVGAVAADTQLPAWGHQRSISTTTGENTKNMELQLQLHPGSNMQADSGQPFVLMTSSMNNTGASLGRTSWFTRLSDPTETNEQRIHLTFIRRRCCNEVIISSFCFFQQRWDEFEAGKYSRVADN